MTPSRSKIVHQFNKHARSYDEHAYIQKSMVQMVIREIKCHTRHMSSALEIGCGTGDLTASLVREFPGIHLTAVDLAEEMIDIARQVVPHSSVDFIIADAEDLCSEDRYDAIVSSATIQWFHSPQLTMARLKRSLRTQGIMVHTTFGPQTFASFYKILDRVADERGSKPVNSRLKMRSIDQWRDLFGSIELEEIAARSEVVEVTYANCRTWLQSLRGTGSAISSGAVVGPSYIREAMRRFDDAHSTEAGIVIRYEVLTLVMRNGKRRVKENIHE